MQSFTQSRFTPPYTLSEDAIQPQEIPAAHVAASLYIVIESPRRVRYLRVMKKVLMILTKDRRDCVDMNLLLHERGGSFEVFDHVVFLLNDVTPQHMRFIDEWIERHPHVTCDKIIGDGTRPKGISDMQNRCIERYPDCFYAKTDEDVFVPPGWARMMWEAYERHRNMDDLALITPLLPNNSLGLYILLKQYYPELLEEHHLRYGRAPEPQRVSFTWNNPFVAEWATRKFLDLPKANQAQWQRIQLHRTPPEPFQNQSVGTDHPFLSFSIPFSIGCIGYDYRHIRNMGGIPWNDEPGWCQWIEENNHINILDCRQISLHYTFFVQQEWLDRSSLIEDIRAVNLPDTFSLTDRLRLHQLRRIIRQMPAIFRRRVLKKST